MEKTKKKAVIIIEISLLIFAIFTIVISQFLAKPKQPDNPSSEEPNTTKKVFNTTISRLDDEETYFKINKAINNFYDLITHNNASNLYTVLESDYLKNNNITKSNVVSKLNNNYNMTNFIAKEIYYNANSYITYYFVSGYFLNTDISTDEATYLKNVNYMLISYQNKYVIRPLDIDLNIESTAKNYALKEVEITNGLNFEDTDISEKNKLSLYLSEYFNTILFYDITSAYALLGPEMQTKYPNVEAFQSDLVNIFSKYSSNIFSYSKEEKEDYTIYKLIDNNQNYITIYEYNIMDYKIAF